MCRFVEKDHADTTAVLCKVNALGVKFVGGAVDDTIHTRGR